jgi:HD-like signal output (HDOD) protein
MFSFFTKKNEDPAKALREAFGSYTLPSFSKADLELMRRIREPDIQASEIAEIVELDPGLSVKLLSLVNSAAFAPRHEVVSLSMAVALVGLSQLESLVMSATLKKGIPRCEDENLSAAAFWTTAAFRGVLARDIARLLCPAQSAECFTAGFLQDMAVPFLINQRGAEYGSIVSNWHAGEAELSEAERELFGWDHAQVATWIAQDWDLPESLASAIGGHHATDDDAYDCPLPVTLVANLSDTDESLERLRERLKEHVPEDKVEGMTTSAQEAAHELAQFMI